MNGNGGGCEWGVRVESVWDEIEGLKGAKKDFTDSEPFPRILRLAIRQSNVIGKRCESLCKGSHFNHALGGMLGKWRS